MHDILRWLLRINTVWLLQTLPWNFTRIWSWKEQTILDINIIMVRLVPAASAVNNCNFYVLQREECSIVTVLSVRLLLLWLSRLLWLVLCQSDYRLTGSQNCRNLQRQVLCIGRGLCSHWKYLVSFDHIVGFQIQDSNTEAKLIEIWYYITDSSW